MTRLKICGIKNIEIAQAVVSFGTDSLGFVFYKKSPRNISVEDTAEIIKRLPAFINKTGVFVEQDVDEILTIVKNCGLDTIQLHGGQTPDFASRLRKKTRLPIILAIRVEKLNEEAVKNLDIDGVNNYIFDRLDPRELGGTGKTIDIHSKFSDDALEFIHEKVIISGGIDASNVKDVVNSLHPFGIDLSSGVEKQKGVKDIGLIKEFFRAFNSI